MTEKLITVVLQSEEFRVALPRDHDFFEENWRAWEHGQTEDRTLAFAARKRPNAVFLDVGAWIGCVTLLAARSSKKVFAFEADPISTKDLARNIEANDLENATIVSKLISDGGGIKTLWSSASGNNAGSSALLEGGKTRWKVEAIRLDDFIEENLKLEDYIVIKIDIEGSEYIVLPTIKRYIKQGRIREMCLSLHPHLIANSVKGNNIGAKIERRVKLVLATARVLHAIGDFKRLQNAEGRGLSRLALLWEIATQGHQSDANRELFLSNDARA